MSLPALFLLAAFASASEPHAIPGFSVSLGPGRRVTGRLTYDARKALSGGWILAAPRAGPEQAAAVRMARAFVSTSGGLFSPAAVAARRHGVPAVVVPQAAFRGGALVVERPVFGAPREVSGAALEPVTRLEAEALEEGRIVSVDSSRGVLLLPAPEDQEDELALDEALTAFEGLADAQALVQWWRGRADGPRSAALAARLADELSRRAALGTARADAVARVLTAVRSAAPKDRRASVERGVLRAVKSALAEGTARLDDLRAAARESASAAAADRVADEAQAAGRRLAQLAAAAPGADASPAKAAAADVSRAAKRRAAELARGPQRSLAESLTAAGARAPRGATLGPEVYADFLAETGLAPLLAEISNDASLDLRRKAERLAGLFAAAEPSESGKAGRAVAAAAPREGLVAVRARGERTVVPARSAYAAVRAAWAGWWSADELGRRKRAGGGAPEPEVRLEPLAPAQVSGLAFSRDPATGRADRVLVSAVLGELEGLSSGEAPADQYALDRSGARELMPALVADKRARLELDPATGKTRAVPVPPGLSLARALSPEQLRRVARAARAAEGWLGAGAQLSFAFSEGELIALGAEPMEAAKLEPKAAFDAAPAAPTQTLDVKSVR